MSRLSVFLSALVLAAVCAAPVASAKTCTRLGFTVNDYGKEGPTRDAKALLDKYIASWAKEKGIKRYRTGKKDVTCKLFLDVGFFDEWTCKASATFCWNGPPYAVEKDKALKKVNKAKKKR